MNMRNKINFIFYLKLFSAERIGIGSASYRWDRRWRMATDVRSGIRGPSETDHSYGKKN